MKRHYYGIVMGLLLTVACGCFGEPKPPAVDVSGEVTLNGLPVTGAAVRFSSSKLGGGAFNLDDFGQFKSSSPLVVGEYLVSLDRPGPNTGETAADITWPEDKSGELPGNYRSPSRSGLTAHVTESEQNHFVFELVGTAPSNRRDRKGPEPITPTTGETG